MTDLDNPQAEVKLQSEEARQGSRPKSLLGVLALSVTLTIVAFAAITVAVSTPEAPTTGVGTEATVSDQ